MRKYFLAVVAITSSVMISCQQSQPSNTQVQPPPATKYVYPPEAISNYVDVCTKKGEVTKQSCNCFISKAQDLYPLDKLIQINNDVSVGKRYPKNIDDILTSCEEKVAVVPAVKTSVVPEVPPSGEENAKRFLKIYFDTIISGERGDVFFCKIDSASSFFSPTDYKILKVKTYDDGSGSANVRVDSSNQGGSKITKIWNIAFKKGTVYAAREGGNYGICLELIYSRD